MNCTEFEIQLVELESRAELTAQFHEDMQEHMHSCRACSAMVEDENFLARQARVLRPMQAPADHVWQRIRATLLAEDVIRVPAPAALEPVNIPASGPPPGRSFTRAPGRAPMSLAYAAVLLLALGVTKFYSLFTGAGAPPVLVVRPALPAIPQADAVTVASQAGPATAPAAAAESELAKVDIEQKALDVPDEYRATMVSTWNDEISTHRQLSDFIELHPEDPFVRGQLMNSEQRLLLILEKFDRWK